VHRLVQSKLCILLIFPQFTKSIASKKLFHSTHQPLTVQIINITGFPTEIVFIFKFLPLPDLGSIRLVCKQWHDGVLSEMRVRIKEGVLFGEGELRFGVSPDRREDVTEVSRSPLEDGTFSSRNGFKQNATLARQGCLVFQDQSRQPLWLYLSVDVGVAHLIFPDVVGNHSSGKDTYSFHCLYLRDGCPVSEDLL
jgi:hypothetical protein